MWNQIYTQITPRKQNIGKENNIVVLIALRYFNRLKLPKHTLTHTQTQCETVRSKNPILKLVLRYVSASRTAVNLDSKSSDSHFHCCYFTEVIHVCSDNSPLLYGWLKYLSELSFIHTLILALKCGNENMSLTS